MKDEGDHHNQSKKKKSVKIVTVGHSLKQKMEKRKVIWFAIHDAELR